MNEIIFLIGFSLFICSVILLVWLPRKIIQFRANQKGLSLSTEEAFIIQNNRCAKTVFFYGVKEIWSIKKIPLQDLILHYHFSGSLSNVANGMVLLKAKQQNVEISTLFAFDLAGKDLKTEIEDSDTVFTIEINNLKNENLNLSFKASFKLSFPESIYMKSEIPNVEKKIRLKLNTFLDTWKNSNIAETEYFIRKNIIPKKLDGINFIRQKFEIKNNWC